VVGTFALGWLLPRLQEFLDLHPEIDLRLFTNNNRVDLAGEGLDLAIRFGDGAWHGTHAEPILAAPLTPLCSPAVAARLSEPSDLGRETLLRSYRSDEWPRWFDHIGLPCPALRGPVFDSSPIIASAAAASLGVGLLPAAMFAAELARGQLIRPFETQVDAGSYWLTRLNSKAESAAMRAFAAWLHGAGKGPGPTGRSPLT
jgi:LysR family transcriptional regulator of beta-lactamase